MLIKFKKADEKRFFKMPEYATTGSSGADLFASLKEDKDFILLLPGTRVLIGTNLMVSIPLGYEAQIRSRSGLALKNGIMVLNSPGTIDCVPKGTMIKTKKGDIEVSKLKEMFISGEIIETISYNTSEKCLNDDILEDIWKIENSELIEIELQNGNIVKIPPTKQIYTKQEGWKFASDLRGDEEILSLE